MNKVGGQNILTQTDRGLSAREMFNPSRLGSRSAVGADGTLSKLGRGEKSFADSLRLSGAKAQQENRLKNDDSVKNQNISRDRDEQKTTKKDLNSHSGQRSSGTEKTHESARANWAGKVQSKNLNPSASDEGRANGLSENGLNDSVQEASNEVRSPARTLKSSEKADRQNFGGENSEAMVEVPQNQEEQGVVDYKQVPFNGFELPASAQMQNQDLEGLTFIKSQSPINFDELNGAQQEDLAVLQELDSFREHQAGRKQRAVIDFMEQMQVQFGVSPKQILSAFAQLDEKTLSGPPEEATRKFVNNLQVPAQQKSAISQLYQQLVAETGEAAFNEKLAGTAEEQVALEIKSSKEFRKNRLNSSLDKMNEQFFMKSPEASEKMSLEAKGSDKQKTLAQLQNESTKSSGPQGLFQQRSGDLKGQAGSNEEAARLMGYQMGGYSEKFGPKVESTTNTLPSGEESVFEASAVGNEALSTQNSIDPQITTQVRQKMAQSKLSEYGANKTEASGKKLNVDDFFSSNDEIDHIGESSTSASSTPSNKGITSEVAAPTSAPGASQLAQKERVENIQELINQSQVLVKKGGGEMRMQLRPEGLGQVNLKVSVENGQVQIQMLTESDKARKMIEEGMHELKADLVSNRLRVESMQVNTTENLKAQADTTPDQQRDLAREMASGFLSQFKEDRQNFRQGFAGSGHRMYTRDPEKRVTMKPETISSNSKRQDASRRLNLVA